MLLSIWLSVFLNGLAEDARFKLWPRCYSPRDGDFLECRRCLYFLVDHAFRKIPQGFYSTCEALNRLPTCFQSVTAGSLNRSKMEVRAPGALKDPGQWMGLMMVEWPPKISQNNHLNGEDEVLNLLKHHIWGCPIFRPTSVGKNKQHMGHLPVKVIVFQKPILGYNDFGPNPDVRIYVTLLKWGGRTSVVDLCVVTGFPVPNPLRCPKTCVGKNYFVTTVNGRLW